MKRRKIIIDTDPGIDDALAIIAAFASPELEIVGLTTTFGNVHTPRATRNAFVLLDVLGVRVPVAEGASGPIDGGGRPHLKVASFVHGEDGLGNTEEERRKERAEKSGGDDDGDDVASRFSADPRSAAEFIADSVSSSPGEVSVLALGPLTNVAEALAVLGKREREREAADGDGSSAPPPASRTRGLFRHPPAHPACSPAAASLFREVVALGGAFFRNGNVTPAAEANVLADPAAADVVLSTPGLSVRMVGLDVTHSCRMSSSQLESLRAKGKRVGGFAADVSKFYLKYHGEAYSMPEQMFVHDPTALAAVLAPHLFTWLEGPVVVCVGEEEGARGEEEAKGEGGEPTAATGLGGFANPLRGMTVVDQGEKRWAAQKNSARSNAWVGRPPARVATACDGDAVVRLVMERLTDAAEAGGG